MMLKRDYEGFRALNQKRKSQIQMELTDLRLLWQQEQSSLPKTSPFSSVEKRY